MKFHSSLALVALPLVAQSAFAQRVEPVNSLGRARSTYDASDADRNGRVTIEEFARQKLEIARADFAAMDVDKDGMWSREEFFVYYRRLLLNSGQRAADDLEAEVARIQAARRAKATSQTSNGSGATPRGPNVAPTSIDDRLRTVIDELEKKALSRQASREDFKRVKDSLIERARLLNAQDPTVPSDLAAKFGAAIDALETKAREGNYSREDFTALRETLISRGREAAKPAPTPAAASVPLTEAQLQTALDAALDDLANKAEARSATRDDYTRVKEAFISRARAAAPNTNPTLAAERVTLEQRFISAIDKLENDAREGRFTRAEFQAMRDVYVSRVRAIVAPPAMPPTPETPVNPAPTTPNDLANKLELALDDLAIKAENRNATREDFGRVRDLMTARARALAGSDPAAQGRLTTLDELFAKAMEKLETDAREGKFSRQEFQTLRDNYVNRARAIAGSGAPTGQPVTTPMPAEVVTAGIEKRFDDALNDLERKAVARSATRADFQRVHDLLVARARSTVEAQNGAPLADSDPRIAALTASLQGALARLEQAANEGRVNAADFANLKQQLVVRAREVRELPPPDVKAPETKPVEPRKPVEPEKPAPDQPGRTRPAPEQPKPEQPPREQPPREQPKPADPPKDERTGRPVTPPHRG